VNLPVLSGSSFSSSSSPCSPRSSESSTSTSSIGFGDVLAHGWQEVNQGTRNIVQRQLNCCGWQGLEEFATNNEPIDDSCYERVTPSISGVVARVEESAMGGSTKRMKQSPCRDNLYEWFMGNKITWVTILASVAAIQVMCIGIAIYILTRVKKIKQRRSSRTVSKRKLYDSSSEGSESHEFRQKDSYNSMRKY